MTPAPTDLDVPCPPAPAGEAGAAEITARPPAVPGRLLAIRRPFDAIEPAAWDALAAASPWATPFARWGVHRAWWDAYGANAHEQTLVVVDPAAPDPDAPVAIVPLMHRHEVEPDDAILRTHLRPDPHLPQTAVAPTAKAVFFGASYHVDYATILARPADLPAVADAVWPTRSQRPRTPPTPTTPTPGTSWTCGASAAATPPPTRWPRRSARGPARAGRWSASARRSAPSSRCRRGSTSRRYLGTLDKKERHEVRRKLRRAEAAGEVRLERSADPVGDLDAFVDLHQKRWGAEGLFPPTAGGDQSRAFFRRLFELLGRRRDGPAPLPGRRRSADRGRRLVRGRRRLVPLQRGGRSRGPRALARRPPERAGDPGRHRRRPAALRLPARRRAVQVRVGRRRRANPAPPRRANRGLEMGAPLPGDPCVKPTNRPPVPGGRPVRVVELMATGTNGGAQEHVYSLLSRMDRDRYEPTAHLALARQRRAQDRPPGDPGPRDRRARRRHRRRRGRHAPGRHRARGRPQPHVPRRAGRDAGGDRPRRGRPRPPVRRGHRPLEPDPLARGPRGPAPPHAAHGPPRRGEPGDGAQDRRRAPQRRPGLAHLQRRGPGPLRPHRPLLHAPRGVPHAGGGADRRRRGPPGAREGPPHAPGRLAAGDAPRAQRLAAGRGRREPAPGAGGAGRRARDRGARRLHRPPRRRPGGDGGAGRGGAPLLPRGPGPHDPRGDGAVPARSWPPRSAASPR